MQLLAAFIVFLSLSLFFLLIFYFRDYTKFESEDDFVDDGGKKGIMATFFRFTARKLSWAITDADSFKLGVINDTKANFMKYKFMIGAVLGIFLFFVLGSPWWFAAGFVLGWLSPSVIITSQYKDWIASVAMDLPSLVQYIMLHNAMGMNMKDSIKGSYQHLDGPLSDMLEEAINNIEQDGNYVKHIQEIRDKVKGGQYESKIEAVFKRIISGWQDTNMQAFEDTSRFLEELEVAKIDKATSGKRLKYVMMLPVGVVSTLLVLAPAALSASLASMFNI